MTTPGSTTDSDRDELTRRQTELLTALVAGGPIPEGFDTERIRVQTTALAAKRRSGVERALPHLAAALGERWPGAFMDWARTHPKPAVGGSRADGHAFAEYLRMRGELPEPLVEARTSRTRRGGVHKLRSWWRSRRARASADAAYWPDRQPD
ncbi:hypothetical protein [Yinghuangia sp. YIM S10712]|uniref:hypothetical protein n=1 Tax=Yinghuangia sp. YIM S10712 TaxID=3436930 RepID=UPI003F53C7E2